MGIRGLFTFLSNEVPGAIQTLSVEDVLQEIRSRDDSPKVIINCHSFYNYFAQNVPNALFAGRFNIIQKEFEEFLETLTTAGAELIFVFKKPLAEREDKWIEKKNKEYDLAQKLQRDFIIISGGRVETENGAQAFHGGCEDYGDFKKLFKYFRVKLSQYYDYDRSISSVLLHSATKFGKFRGNDLFSGKANLSHIRIANELNALAIIGLDTGYLFFEGSSKLWFPKPVEEISTDYIKFDIQQHDKEIILDRFGHNYEKFQLFAVLAQKFSSTQENSEKLELFFMGHNRVQRIVNFVNKNVKFPLTQQSLESIVSTIFGSADPTIVQGLQNAMETFKYSLLNCKSRFKDEIINKLIVDDPFSLAERILNKVVLNIHSPCFDIHATDMKPLHELILPWIRRTMGILLKNDDEIKELKVMYRIDEEHFEKVVLQPECPEFLVPELKHLIAGGMSIEEKFQFLAFITGIEESILKRIPNGYLMHFVVVYYLWKNESLKDFEVCAFTKALKDFHDCAIPSVVLYPEKVIMRAFRTSHLYTTIYYYLTCCLATLGLKDFITGIVMDNVQYQIYYQAMMHKDQTAGEIFDHLIEIIMT